jgi:demethoxyubiquinone hydroxylase (CLK1/Coq7/Cat5 family)
MLSVYFDGACPLCVREVAVYRRQAPADVRWENLAEPEVHIPRASNGYMPARDVLLRRFHVHTADGRWLHGAPAFAMLWARLGWPWRSLSLIGRLPGGLWCMDVVYSLFLRVRPRLQRLVWHLVKPDVVPQAMIAAIRSDQAGETGAVWIYRAMQLFNRSPELRPLLEEHREQEARHLQAMNRLLPWRYRSRLLPFWRVAGFITGMMGALGGRRWTLATIASVERFVDRHYQEQIDYLAMQAVPEQPVTSGGAATDCAAGRCALARPSSTLGDYPDLISLLRAFREDELRHRDDALAGLSEAGVDQIDDVSVHEIAQQGRLLTVWCTIVERGSEIAVRFAKFL